MEIPSLGRMLPVCQDQRAFPLQHVSTFSSAGCLSSGLIGLLFVAFSLSRFSRDVECQRVLTSFASFT
jgi:hypothetical protein